MFYLSKIRTEVNKNHELGTHSLCLYCLIFCFGLFLQPLMDVFQTFLRTVQYGKSPTGLSGGLSVSGGGMRYETLALTCLKSGCKAIRTESVSQLQHRPTMPPSSGYHRSFIITRELLGYFKHLFVMFTIIIFAH